MTQPNSSVLSSVWGLQSTFTAQTSVFSCTPDELRLPLKYLFYTQCIRNQHFQFLLKAWGCRVPHASVHVLSTWTHPCPGIRASCGNGAPISNSIVRKLSGLWTVMLHPFCQYRWGSRDRGFQPFCFHAATSVHAGLSLRERIGAILQNSSFLECACICVTESSFVGPYLLSSCFHGTRPCRGNGVVSYTIWCSFLYDTYPDVS